MNEEYNGVERVYLIRDAEKESIYYERAAERCVPLILDGSTEAYVIMRHYAAKVDAKQTLISQLKDGGFAAKLRTIGIIVSKRTR